MSLRIILSIFLLVFSIGLNAQTYTLNATSNNTTVNTCSGTFFDPGGPGGNYGNNQDYTITFCSDNGGPIEFNFSYFDTELSFDYLSVYDGTSTLSAPLAGSPFNNNDLDGEIITSSAGCLTFNFDSDGSITRPGWEAEISCPVDCQAIQGNLTSISPTPNPTTGILQICQQEEVSFTAEGIYPENNTSYSQSDATSTFSWSFGNGQTATGTSVNHTYNDPGAYEVNLIITDLNGCTSGNISQTIHVSTTPIFNGTSVLEEEICLGAENVLTGVVTPVTFTSECENVDAEFVAIPDVQNQVHSSAVTLDCYANGETLNNISDLEGICLNIEHSFVGDLSIEIICPNNQTVELLDYPNGGGGAYLGVPVDVEGQPNNAGTGFEYCFTNSPTYGDLASDLPGGTQPAGSYQSVQALTGLLGCPLNGDWTISINDNIGLDNGFLFYWSLNINPDLLVAEGEFTPIILTEEWVADLSIISTTGTSITVEPTTVGDACYTYEVTDDFGCSYDTTLCFEVLESASNITFDPIPSLCENDAVINVTSNVVGGIWSGDVNLDGTFDPSVGQGSYSGTLTLGTGTTCEISETLEITVNPEATAILTGSGSFCSGTTTDLEINFTGTAPWTIDYSLDSDSQGEIVTSDNPLIIPVSEAGEYHIESVNDQNCIGTFSGIAEITETGTPSISNVLETCSVDLLSYTISFDITGGDPNSYSVIEGGNIIGNTFTSDPIPNNTNYTFTLSDANACGSDIIDGIYDCGCAANATISGDIDLCSNELGFIQVDFVGFGPWSFEYNIDGDPQGTVNTNESSYSFEVSIDGEYELTTMNDAFCEGDVFGVATVNDLELPTASIFGDFDICVGEEAELSIELTGTGPWSVDYSIGGIPQTDVLNSTTNNILFLSSVDGQYTIDQVSDANCSNSGTGQSNLNVHELPEAVIGGNLVICENNPGVLVVDLIGTPGFELTYSVEGILQEPLTIEETNQFEFLVEETGEYELLTIQDLYCSGIASGITNVELAPLPTGMVTGDFIICDGDVQEVPTNLTGTAPWTINYSINGDAQTAISTSDPNYFLEATQEGTYTLTTIEDLYCYNSGSGLVDIEFYPPLLLTTSLDSGVCVGEQSTSWASVSGGIGEPYSFSWTGGDLNYVSDTSVTLYADQTTTLTVTASDLCGYEETAILPITVHQLPPIGLIGQTSKCGIGYEVINNATPISYIGSDCQWIINGDSVSSNCNGINYFFGDVGTYDIDLMVTSPEGCVNQTLFEEYFEIYSQPISSFSFEPNEPSVVDPIVSFTNESTEDVVGFEWTIGDLAYFQDENISYEFPVEKGPDDWMVCLSVVTGDMCVDNSCLPIGIKPEILSHIANSFTPDGDGLNEFFDPFLVGLNPDYYECLIYDRTGKLVFQSTDINEKWNGSYFNNDQYYAMSGVYNWQITVRLDGSTDDRLLRGWVNLIR